MGGKSSKIAQPTLRGKQIFLRSPVRADFHEYAALRKISAPFFGGLLATFGGRKQFNEYLQRCEREDFYGYRICRNRDGAIVGDINLFHLVRRNLQSVTVGYFVGAPHVRQGYATEALQLAQRFVFATLKLHRLEACIQPHNTASIALVKRAGFVREGVSRRLIKIAGKWRDHERWAILAEDWKRSRRSLK